MRAGYGVTPAGNSLKGRTTGGKTLTVSRAGQNHARGYALLAPPLDMYYHFSRYVVL